MSLMGVVMLTGIAVSNSILIVEFTRQLREQGMEVREAVTTACRVRLRPVLMTSLATIIGLLPMALKLGEGSESYAPLARALLGGLALCGGAGFVFLVPAACVLAYGARRLERPCVFSLLLAFLISAPVWAQPPLLQLALADAEKLAIQNNPQFSAARLNAAAAYQIPLEYRADLPAHGQRRGDRK